ncbi:MAG TPA: hypothetical protein VKK31_17380 [Thermoanaerobaculia bacterium]|nr:hypothetical protein [Thermoanaerobaculia bacterium]
MSDLDNSWYHIVAKRDLTLQQGDILFGFEYLCPTAYVWPRIDTPEPTLSLVKADVLVLTASCDLDLTHTKKKIDFVLLCPHWEFDQAAKSPEVTGVKPSNKAEIESGKMPRYCLLAASDLSEFPMGLRMVDFNRLFQIPRSFVDACVAEQWPRLRMNPPYREHLAQSFGTCFTRIGLPQRATQVTPLAPTAPATVSSPGARPASPEEVPGPLPQS